MNLGEHPISLPRHLQRGKLHLILCPTFPSYHEAPFIREEEEEDWEQDSFPPTTLTVGQPGGTKASRLELAGGEYHYDEKEGELEDFLMGDDPSMYSDEFSGPEDEF